ncbi:MAG: T9SS type A sorting domain-containing protein [Ferruginibacter sp.]
MKRPLQFVLPIIFSIASLSNFAADRNPLKDNFQTTTTDIKMLSSFLFTASGNTADGNRVVFDSQYSNAIDGNDAIKLMNPGENFGLLRDTRILAVEARQPIANGDTLFYNMSNLVSQVYKLDIIPQNLVGTTANCELVDRYLNTRKNISLRDSNHFNIEITSDPASRALNRLIVVFSTTVIAPLPFKFSNISAINNENKFITVNWEVSQEMNESHYEIERSADNFHFSKLSTSLPLYNDHDGGKYQYQDAQPLDADNYYRIKAIDITGVSIYSDKVKVSFTTPKTTMNIYPNPVVNHGFQLQLYKLMPGKYFIKLTNNSGQQVYSTSFSVSGTSFIQTIKLTANVGKGNYNVTVWSENGILGTEKIVVE